MKGVRAKYEKAVADHAELVTVGTVNATNLALQDPSQNFGSEQYQTLAFNAVAGARLDRINRMLSNPKISFATLVILNLSEASRLMAHWFQDAAEGRLRLNRPA
eukprot:4889381-Pyramimonas_sp.AAC.1